MKPTFPLHVLFDDGDEWILDTLREVGSNLEWFDSEHGDDSVYVIDAENRPVRLLVRNLEVVTCELGTTPTRRPAPQPTTLRSAA